MKKDADWFNSGPGETIVLEPQPGPQTTFLSTSADIAIYGGAAGGGKTWSLLYEVLRNIDVPNFGAVVFRQTYPQIINQGALWDESMTIFPKVSAEPTKSSLTWTFTSGAKCTFRHMQHENDKLDYQGSQIPYIGFDELTHFTKGQFMYMLSRNRSVCGVVPYMRATCNPDANSWVKMFLAPWLDRTYIQPEDLRLYDAQRSRMVQDDTWNDVTARELPLPAPRTLVGGEIAYFSGVDGKWLWHTKAEYDAELLLDPEERTIKTLTFVPASVYDNKILLKRNPQYLASLKALPLIEQERLLKGNWDIVESGNMFRPEWFPIHYQYEMPHKFKRLILYADFASTKPAEIKKRKSDPDYTCFTTLGQGFEKRYYMLDQALLQDTPGETMAAFARTAIRIKREFGANLEVWMEQEPGSSGAMAVYAVNEYMMKHGFRCRGLKSTGSKIERAKDVSKDAQEGNVWMLNDMYGLREDLNEFWNSRFFSFATAFPDPDGKVKDDVVDSLSGAHNVCNLPPEDYTYNAAFSGVSSRWARG